MVKLDILFLNCNAYKTNVVTVYSLTKTKYKDVEIIF